LSRNSILLVDDEAGIRQSLSAVLREEGFKVETADSGEACLSLLESHSFELIILDVWLPGIDGLWGSSVFHCAFCDGWEVRDQALGVLASGPMAVHQALLFRQLTADVVLFAHTGPALTDEQAQQLAARDIRVIDGPIAGLVVTDDHLTGIRMDDGTVVTRQALVVGAPVWLLRVRWREGLRERLGAGAARVGHALAGRQQVWVHAVSVGGVMVSTEMGPVLLLTGKADLSHLCRSIEIINAEATPGNKSGESPTSPPGTIFRCKPRSRSAADEGALGEVLLETDAADRLVRVLIRERGNVETEFRFGNWEENLFIPEMTFHFVPPPGVAIVDEATLAGARH